MKIGKTGLLILGIGIFVIAFGGLYVVYARQSDEEQRLEADISVARIALTGAISAEDGLQNQVSQLERQLAESRIGLDQAERSLQQAAVYFPEVVRTIEYGEMFFALANEHDLTLTTFTPSPPAHKDVEGVTFSVTSFSLEVVGEVPDILGFISTIAAGGDYFASAAVMMVDIMVAEPAEEIMEEPEKSSASIRLAIYGYE